jgi:hypothetical protein
VARRLVELNAVPASQADAAADTIYALASPEVYSLLVRDRGGPADDYQQWLAEKLIAAVLDDTPPGNRRRRQDRKQTGQGQ